MAGGQDSLELLVHLCKRLGLASVVEAPDAPSLAAALAARPHVSTLARRAFTVWRMCSEGGR
jgi:hypothetical protein